MSEIKTTSHAVLRRKLRDCDRKLAWWDQVAKYMRWTSVNKYQAAMQALDAKRRAIREKLKER